MSVEITGFVSAPSVPEGARLTRVTWEVPGDYGYGTAFDTQEQALAEAAAEARRTGRNRVTVDLRWKFVFPGGGGMETTVTRYTYDTLADAEEHLGRIRFFAKDH